MRITSKNRPSLRRDPPSIRALVGRRDRRHFNLGARRFLSNRKTCYVRIFVAQFDVQVDGNDDDDAKSG